MKVVFDTSVWVEHLRLGSLDDVVPHLRGHFLLWMDSVSMAELLAGCRSKIERRVVTRMLAPFERAGRVAHPGRDDFRRAATALSRLRERGRSLRNPGGALLDALTATAAARLGALIVTNNLSDFDLLATELPVRVEGFRQFRESLGVTR